MTDPEALARDRDRALALLEEWVKSPSLRRHCRAVEVAMRAYAVHLGEDADAWGNAGLLHDFDWEIHPTLEQHPADGAPMLREAGWPEVVVRAIQAHAPHTGVVPETNLERYLFACDELSGFVVAVARMRPEGFGGMKPKSVTKKLKTPSFAAGVSREDVAHGCELIGLEPAEHIANVIEALAPISDQLLV
ncbi:MAG: HDIG domain-containing protein [Thermoleophilia bacterium]|nr:HDIG domain-containing protein [Thermoleophilia bacterium]